MDILTIDADREKVVIGFINSDGDLEYTIFKEVDGGTLEVSKEDPNYLGNLLAYEASMSSYSDYTLEEIV